MSFLRIVGDGEHERLVSVHCFPHIASRDKVCTRPGEDVSVCLEVGPAVHVELLGPRPHLVEGGPLRQVGKVTKAENQVVQRQSRVALVQGENLVNSVLEKKRNATLLDHRRGAFKMRLVIDENTYGALLPRKLDNCTNNSRSKKRCYKKKKEYQNATSET